MGMGIGFGNAARGYKEGRDDMLGARDRREDREWKLGRRERKLEQEDWNDPMIRGAAERANRKGILTEQVEQLYTLDEARMKFEQASRDEEVDVLAQPGKVAGVGIADRAARMEDARNVAAQPGKMAGIGYADTAAQRADELGTAGQESALEQQGFAATRAQEEDAYQSTEARNYKERQDDLSYARDSANAIGNFKQSGNPQALQDFYNDVYENDEIVEIVKLPDGRYQATYTDPNTGETRQSEPVTQEDLLQSTQAFFDARPDTAVQSVGGYGGGVSGSYRGPSGRGRPGQRGAAGKQSAYAEKVYMLADNYMRSEGLSEVEALAKAHRVSGQKANRSEKEVARAFFQDILKRMLPSDDEGYGAEKMQTMTEGAVERAQELTKEYMGMDWEAYNGSGEQKGIPVPQGGGQTTIPQGAIDDLRADPDSPGAREEFDETFGEGAAEEVLNG